MNVRTVFTINALLGLVFGLGFLLLPGLLFSIFGITSGPGTTYIAQLLGATLTGLSVTAWLARDSRDSQSVRAIMLGLLIFNALGAVVSALAVLSGVTNALGWLLVVVLLIEALPRVYLLFMKPAPA